MRNLLNQGKQLIAWGTALIFFGSICIFMNVGTFVAVLGAISFGLGLLLVISGSVISTTAASPRRAAQFGGVATVIGAITFGAMLLFPKLNFQGPEMPPIYVVVALTVLALLTYLVALLRLTLDRRAGRVS